MSIFLTGSVWRKVAGALGTCAMMAAGFESFIGARLVRIAVIVCCLSLLGRLSDAQELIKRCPHVEVESIDVSADFRVSVDHNPDIKIVPTHQLTTLDNSGKAVTFIVFGPILGSMDSSAVQNDIACTANGFTLTAWITRAADYNGTAAKNVLWRPKLTIAVELREPEVVFQTTWRMRLTTGTEVDHAQTPSLAEQNYPITVTKTVRSASAQWP